MPRVVINALTDYSMFGSKKYRPLKLPLSCEVVEKGGLGLRFVGGGGTPDFEHEF